MYVTTSMEVTPVTFNTYRLVFLHTEPSIIGIPRIIRDFIRRFSLQSTTAMVFVVATMTYILAFPTLGSAMTGYNGNVKSFVADYDGNFIPFESFSLVSYVIHDGWRINKTAEFAVTSGQSLGKWNIVDLEAERILTALVQAIPSPLRMEAGSKEWKEMFQHVSNSYTIKISH